MDDGSSSDEASERRTNQVITPWKAPPRCHRPRCRSERPPSDPEPGHTETHLQREGTADRPVATVTATHSTSCLSSEVKERSNNHAIYSPVVSRAICVPWVSWRRSAASRMLSALHCPADLRPASRSLTVPPETCRTKTAGGGVKVGRGRQTSAGEQD